MSGWWIAIGIGAATIGLWLLSHVLELLRPRPQTLTSLRWDAGIRPVAVAAPPNTRGWPMPYVAVPLPHRTAFSDAEMKARADDFYAQIQRRHTVRDFDPRPVPRAIIESCLLAAGTAPSGANRQPWHFAVVSDQRIKTKIREAAEQEERKFYEGRAGAEWLAALEPLGTDSSKPFLEVAPWLIVVFGQR